MIFIDVTYKIMSSVTLRQKYFFSIIYYYSHYVSFQLKAYMGN